MSQLKSLLTNKYGAIHFFYYKIETRINPNELLFDLHFSLFAFIFVSAELSDL